MCVVVVQRKLGGSLYKMRLFSFFLAEAHVREDSRQLVDAVEHHDLAQADSSTQLIRRRCERLMQAIDDNLGIQPSHYTQQQAGKLATHLKELSKTGLGTGAWKSGRFWKQLELEAGFFKITFMNCICTMQRNVYKKALQIFL